MSIELEGRLRRRSYGRPVRARRSRIRPGVASAILAGLVALTLPQLVRSAPTPAAAETPAPAPRPGEQVTPRPTVGTPSAPRLEHERLPAAGRQATDLAIGQFGRYSIRVESKQGVALQVVDRMSGPGEIAGEAGARDGRLDLFLDRGTVRVVTFGPKLGRGEARLTVTPFRELHSTGASASSGSSGAPDIPRLPELRQVSEELGDLEQASWWIELPERQQVVLEAAGRYLADLRLWQNGSWLVDSAPEHSTVTPVPGRPLHLCRLSADLGPGLYLLVAYGGPETAWARGGREKPLHLRFGLPRRGEAGRERISMGPFGFERYLLPGSATLVRLELPEALPATLEVADFDAGRPFESAGESSEITAESVPPVAQIERSETEASALVTVSAAAGQAFTLQHFRAEHRVELSGDGRYWVGSVHAGPAGDSIDASAVLFERGQKRTVPLAGYLPELSSARGWARRFNLLDEATLFFRIAESGIYALDLRGAAQVRLEPLLISRPDGYEPPPLRSAPTTWNLDKGLYVMTFVPVEAGIVDAAFRRQGLLDPMLDWVGLGKEPPPSPVLGAIVMPDVRLSRKSGYILLVSSQPGVQAGPVVRQLPLDLSEPLPLSLLPGQEVGAPFRAATNGRLSAPAEDGTALEISLDGGNWTTTATVAAGEHRVKVRSRAADTLSAALALVPDALLPDSPLPSLSPEAQASLPTFSVLSDTAPLAFDLARGESRTMLVEAPSPALYTLETTGLLATSATVRTRVQPGLGADSQNGTGRNVSLRSYLREGSYQFTVQALGESAGHLGARLGRAKVREGGRLSDGVAARTDLPAGQSVAYRFAVEQEGSYYVHVVRLGGHLDVRLEDSEGFPPAAPVLPGDSTVSLLPGEYRLVVLPQAVPTRAVTVVSRVQEPVERHGHGPFELALDAPGEHLWLEPASAAEPRESDRWRFELPAPTGVKISLDAEMEADLLRLEAGHPGAEKVGLVAPGRGFSGELAAGRYELAVRCSRRNSQVRYSVRVAPDALLDGLSRLVTAPTLLPVAIGREGLVELSSFGGADVRARLLDRDGKLLAAGDDRPGDWNFLLARRLAPGLYRLRVDPVGAESGETRVSLRMPRERDLEPWQVPSQKSLDLADEAVRIPLQLPEEADLLAIVAVAAEPLGLELERRDGAEWTAVSSAEGTTPNLLLPLSDARVGGRPELRLRLRSLDRRPATVRLAAFAGRAPRVKENALAAGLELPRLPGLLPPIAAALVALDRPGCFALEGAPEELVHARRAAEPLTAQPGALVGDGPRLWLAAPADTGASLRVTARRVAVGGEPLSLRLAPGETVSCDLAAAAAPRFLEARALAGEPLVAAGGEGSLPAFERTTVLGRHRAAALASAGAKRAVVRNAGPTPLELRLTATPLALPTTPAGAPPLALGASELELPPRSARLVPLPAGAKSVGLALAEGGAAWLDSDAGSFAFSWAAEEAREDRFATAASSILLVNPTAGEVATRLELRQPDGDDTAVAIAPGARLERRFRRQGGLRLPVPPSNASDAGSRVALLHLRGATATLLGADGSVARGQELALPAGGGTLLLDHPPGLVTLWVDGAEPTLAALGFAPAGGRPERLTLPTTLELAGPPHRVEVNVEVEITAPSLLSLRAASPLAVALVDEQGKVTRFAPFDREVAFDAPLAAGRARISVRGLAGEPLAGRLELTLSPLTPLGEGLGESTLLPPGGARGYSFQVERTGPVGIGARADAGAVETEVFDSAGAPLGRGVVQWLELAPGSYTMTLVGPADAGPISVRPALVGIARPGDGPPREVVRQLLELERGGPPPATSGVTGAEDTARPFGRDLAREGYEPDQDVEDSEDVEDEESGESGGEG